MEKVEVNRKKEDAEGSWTDDKGRKRRKFGRKERKRRM